MPCKGRIGSLFTGAISNKVCNYSLTDLGSSICDVHMECGNDQGRVYVCGFG